MISANPLVPFTIHEFGGVKSSSNSPFKPRGMPLFGLPQDSYLIFYRVCDYLHPFIELLRICIGASPHRKIIFDDRQKSRFRQTLGFHDADGINDGWIAFAIGPSRQLVVLPFSVWDLFALYVVLDLARRVGRRCC